MSSRFRKARAVWGLVALGLFAACDREERRFREIPPGATALPAVTQNDANQPGPFIRDPEIRNTYEENAWAISEGNWLYTQWNCAGCHSPRGGGGMGPPLMDSLWIYGSEPENLFQTIVEGRPNGMPAFRGRIGNADVWKLVAYVRSLAALTPMDTRSGRTDDIHATTPTPQTDANLPMARRIPPEQRPPGMEAP